jgi:8-oxo-dGTP pyrophosphatase MutT (NUDIX family)
MSIRAASTLLALRDGAGGLEVLMLRRSPELFGAGWWVFPGGSVDDVDRGPLAEALIDGVSASERPWISAAVRETAEEVNLYLIEGSVDTSTWADLEGEALYSAMVEGGVSIDGASLGYLSNWITPEQVKKRFDTRFYVAAVTDDGDLAPDEREVDAIEWVRPPEMLERDRADYPVIFPTMKHLELLSRFDTVAAVLAHTAATQVVPIQPRMRRGAAGEVILTIPGEPEYEDSPVRDAEVN